MKAEAKHVKEKKLLKNIHRTDIEQYNIPLEEILGSLLPHLKDECLSRKCVSVKLNSLRAKAWVSVLNLVTYDLQKNQLYLSLTYKQNYNKR